MNAIKELIKHMGDHFSNLNKKTIHQHCINILLTEGYKYLNGYSPDLMNKVFYLRQNHSNLMQF